MKKGQIVEGIVEHVDFPNKGVVLIEETNEAGERETHRVEVKGVIPGQKVRVSIKKARKGKAKGILREVTERSAIETAKPECPHFGTCGGCSYQTIPYDKQLELKKNQVLDLLHPVCDGISDFVFDGILSSPKQWEYRNKMEFSFGDAVAIASDSSTEEGFRAVDNVVYAVVSEDNVCIFSIFIRYHDSENGASVISYGDFHSLFIFEDK